MKLIWLSIIDFETSMLWEPEPRATSPDNRMSKMIIFEFHIASSKCLKYFLRILLPNFFLWKENFFQSSWHHLVERLSFSHLTTQCSITLQKLFEIFIPNIWRILKFFLQNEWNISFKFLKNRSEDASNFSSWAIIWNFAKRRVGAFLRDTHSNHVHDVFYCIMWWNMSFYNSIWDFPAQAQTEINFVNLFLALNISI